MNIVAVIEADEPRLMFVTLSTSSFSFQYSQLQTRCVKWMSINTTCIISSPNPMFDHLLESSRWDDSYKWLNIGFGEEMGIIEIKYAPYLPWYLVVHFDTSITNLWTRVKLYFGYLTISLVTIQTEQNLISWLQQNLPSSQSKVI